MTAAPAPRLIGRRPAEESLPERIEGRFYDISAECVYGEANIVVSRRHDADADAAVEQIDRLALELLEPSLTRHRVHEIARAIRRQCVAYRLADGHEDAEIGLAEFRFVAAHDRSRFGASEIELALSGVTRHRRTARTRGGEQSELFS